MNYVLIGYRGAGKTTVAQRLALLLGWDWIDADVEIELRGGKSIAEIFADDGEERFRDLESDVLAELSARERLVLALGGGAVLRRENRRRIKDAGTVVWLVAPPEELWRRIVADAATAARRPPLTSHGGEAEIVEMLALRAPLYRECADLEVPVCGRPPDDIAAEILARCPLSSLAQE